ncbi:MAG: recombinase family protein [Patescibacteria group bacterium]|nr:recombinase family protein [Patescibacteria group bacterium]
MDPTPLTSQTFGAVNNATAQEAKPTRYCLYARKSTESDEQQALSIDSQIKEMIHLAQRDGIQISEIKRESHSAKASGQRPIFNELLEDIRQGKFDGILAWAPDRLSRNAGDLGGVVDLMDQGKLKEIRTYGQKFTNSPNEKFLLMILCSQAKLENDNKGVNVKRGLKTRVEMGLWPCSAPTGYLNETANDRKGYVIIDPHRGPIIKQVFEKVGKEGWSGRRIYFWLLDVMKFKTKWGKPLTLSNVYNLLKNTFYTGIFEYPKGSGNWYTGKHTPLVSKELFEQVRTKLFEDCSWKPNDKEFNFTRLIKCGLCGSGITAMEKFKQQRNGNSHHYIYYYCTKFNDKYCKLGCIREEEILKQLLEIIDKVKLDEIGLQKRLNEEVQKYNKFRQAVMGKDSEVLEKQKDRDTRNYAKYILKEGTRLEKHELLSNLKSKLIIKDRTVRLA